MKMYTIPVLFLMIKNRFKWDLHVVRSDQYHFPTYYERDLANASTLKEKLERMVTNF